MVRSTPTTWVRVTTAFTMLLRLPGVNVTTVASLSDTVVVDVGLRNRRPVRVD